MKFKSEAELAERVVAYLEDQKWEVYQEVEIRRHSGVADIVAVQNKLVWIIECKLLFGLKVISQAFGWKNVANFVSVAVPSVRSNGFGDLVLNKFGIGRLIVKDYEIYEGRSADFNRKASRDMILKALKPEHKVYAKAGNNHGHRWTPFKQTCNNVLNKVRTNPGICLKDLIGSIETHYGSHTTAKQCLRMWIESGHVPGVCLKREGKFLRLYEPTDKKCLSVETRKEE